MEFSSKSSEVGCHFLHQGIFPTQGSNPSLLCLLRWQADSLLQVPPGNFQYYLILNFIYVSLYVYTVYANVILII